MLSSDHRSTVGVLGYDDARFIKVDLDGQRIDPGTGREVRSCREGDGGQAGDRRDVGVIGLQITVGRYFDVGDVVRIILNLVRGTDDSGSLGLA